VLHRRSTSAASPACLPLVACKPAVPSHVACLTHPIRLSRARTRAPPSRSCSRCAGRAPRWRLCLSPSRRRPATVPALLVPAALQDVSLCGALLSRPSSGSLRSSASASPAVAASRAGVLWLLQKINIIKKSRTLPSACYAPAYARRRISPMAPPLFRSRAPSA